MSDLSFIVAMLQHSHARPVHTTALTALVLFLNLSANPLNLALLAKSDVGTTIVRTTLLSVQLLQMTL